MSERRGETSRSGLHGSACDACRRRRVKCNSQQPCNQCRRNSISCTFGNLSARTTSVGYARHLEKRVEELEGLLREATTTTTTHQPTENPDSTSVSARSRRSSNDQALTALRVLVNDREFLSLGLSTAVMAGSPVLYGRFSGVSVLHAILVHLTESPTPQQQIYLKSSGQDLLQSLDHDYARIALAPSTPQLDGLPELPPRHQAEAVIHLALTYALVGYRCLDPEDLSTRVNRLYGEIKEYYTAADWDSLALVFGILALGYRVQTTGGAGLSDKKLGQTYFRASCQLSDQMMAQNLSAVRTSIMQARYLSSCFMLSQAYVRVQIGITVAQRLGLPDLQFDMTENEAGGGEDIRQRKMVFATLNMQETFVASIIGIPKTLPPEEEPVLGFDGEGAQSGILAISDAVRFQQLAYFMARILQHRRPRMTQSGSREEEQSWQTALSDDPLFVSDLVSKLDQWYESLAAPNNATTDPSTLLSQLSVRLLYAVTQCMLYRPYLYYLRSPATGSAFDIQGYEYGSRCVAAATQAVWVLGALKNNHLLYEAHWLTIYSLVYSLIVLIFFVKNAKNPVGVDESSAVVDRGRHLLQFLGAYNNTAEQCYRIITTTISSL